MEDVDRTLQEALSKVQEEVEGITTTLPPSTVLSDSAEDVQLSITGFLSNPVFFQLPNPNL